jgi:hypothetical protein
VGCIVPPTGNSAYYAPRFLTLFGMTYPLCRVDTSCGHTARVRRAEPRSETSARRIDSMAYPESGRWAKLSPDWQLCLLRAKISHPCGVRNDTTIVSCRHFLWAEPRSETSACGIGSVTYPESGRWAKLSPDWQFCLLRAKIPHCVRNDMQRRAVHDPPVGGLTAPTKKVNIGKGRRG